MRNQQHCEQRAADPKEIPRQRHSQLRSPACLNICYFARPSPEAPPIWRPEAITSAETGKDAYWAGSALMACAKKMPALTKTKSKTITSTIEPNSHAHAPAFLC